jgi:hypothetical protein
MTDLAKELEAILKTDPLGLLDIKPKASSAISADERLLASFEEINSFLRKHDREPTESRDIVERKLFSRLRGLRESPPKAAMLKDHDVFDLLVNVKIPEPKEINTINDIMDDDILGVLGGGATDEQDPNDIFSLRNVPKTIDMPSSIAKRKPCKDFDRFEKLFKQCYADLDSGANVLWKFAGEQQITSGQFFILHGVMVYVAEVGAKDKKRGKINARLRCIFENGTESNMLLRSLATELYKDETGRRVVDTRNEILKDNTALTAEDAMTGHIYVLRSQSDAPEIKEISNLYKIGYSSQPVNKRIQNASQEPTYLMADVTLITEFETYNVNPQKLEMLLHTFFAESCLNLDVFDNEGKRHTPREWFIVPLHVIETAVQLLINGDIVNYRYDSQGQEIVEK